MKGLLLLFGESFRYGGGGIRNRGTPQSYPAQMKAAESHNVFIDRCKQKGIEISVGISSYTTPYQEDLKAAYPNCKFSLFHPYLMGHKGLIQTGMSQIDVDIENYDFVFYMRIDLFLKDPFLDLFEPWETIRFISICWERCHRQGNDPRVNDMMMYIPKKYFRYLDRIELCHETWNQMVSIGIRYEDIDMMCDTYHDSDSEKDYNPYYYIVNRPICDVHYSNKIFNKYSF
jgi:hypothetical protein